MAEFDRIGAEFSTQIRRFYQSDPIEHDARATANDQMADLEPASLR